jgi:ribosomal protein S18 acetylase RimI-like enzyme
VSVTERIDIRKAQPEELAVAAAVLARAFADDPVFVYCFPDAERRRRGVPAFFDLVVRTLAVYDEIYLAGDAAAAVWVPPGEPPVPEEAAEAFGAQAVEIGGEDMERFGAVMKLTEEHHPAEPCAYLWFIGVDPGRQRRGLGSALMTPLLQRYDAQRMPAYLEATSPRNRDLYLRHGFAVVSELTLPDGPQMWPMWREPSVP